MNKLAEFFQSNHTGLGVVFYPTHFIFAAFPSLALARDAAAGLIERRFAENEVYVASGTEVPGVLQRVSRGERPDLSGILGLIDELRFCELDIERARAGVCFVAVHCRTEKDAQRIKTDMEQFSVIGMQWYRSFTIEY